MYSVLIDASSTNIPTSYSTAAGSLVISSAAAGGQISIQSTCTDTICWSIVPAPKETVPTSSLSSNPLQGVVMRSPSGGGAVIVQDFTGIGIGDKLYIRSAGSTITSGLVAITIW